MKTNIPARLIVRALLSVALLAGSSASTQATDVFTDPVGFYQVPIVPGAAAVSFPMQEMSAYRGLVSSANTTNITVEGTTGWSVNQFAPTNGFTQYILIVKKDNDPTPENIEGDWWPIVANGTNNVLVDDAYNGMDNPATILSTQDQIEIRPLVSLKNIFGAGSACILNKSADKIPNSNTEDLVRYVSGTSFSSTFIYYDGSAGGGEGYYRSGVSLGDGSTVTLFPDQVVVVFRKSGTASTNSISLGQVQTTRLTHYLPPGRNTIGVCFPANAPVSNSNLLASGWVGNSTGAPNINTEDIVRAVSGTSFSSTLYYRTGPTPPAGWYISGTLTNGYPFVPGSAYTFYIPGADALRWRQTVPFTLP